MERVSRMFGWFKNLFRKESSSKGDASSAPSKGGFFEPKERQIYSYWNGTDVIEADPMTLFRKIMDVGPELAVDVKLADSISKDAAAGFSGMVTKSRTVFGIKSFEEGGLTENESVQLLDNFLGWCQEQKKNMNPTPTAATVTPAASGHSWAGPSTIPSSSGCGSTVDVQNIEEPKPLP